MTESSTNRLTHDELRQFTGDIVRYRTINRFVVYTPGVKHLAERAGAYWLIDAIASYFTGGAMKFSDRRLQTLQFWRLDVHDDRSATLAARADSGAKAYVTQQIEYTDFPLDSIDVWAGSDGQRWTLYLPSEH